MSKKKKMHAGSMTAVCGLSPMISALSVNPSKPTSPIYLLPRFPSSSGGEARDWRIPIEAPSQMWVLHVGNAFEEKDGNNGKTHIQIQASGCSYRWFNFPKMFGTIIFRTISYLLIDSFFKVTQKNYHCYAGYDWQSGKLDPSMMNVMGQDKMLPHLVQVLFKLSIFTISRKRKIENNIMGAGIYRFGW